MNELQLRMQEVEGEERLSNSALDNVEWEGEARLPDLQLVERRPEQLRHKAQVRSVWALRGKYRLRHDAVLEPGMHWGVLVGLGSVVHLAEAAPDFELEELAGFDPACVVHGKNLDGDVSLVKSAGTAPLVC